MSKLVKFLIGIIAIVLVVVVVMAIFSVCPPKGPWPMPPWCAGEFEIFQYEVNAPAASLSQGKAVNMYDTWGRNYNMGMVETTQANIESSFDRVQKLGAKEVVVHDFDRAIYEGDFDYKSVNYKFEDETFWNDFRDQSISKSEIKKLADEAHARGMTLTVKRNLHFINIGSFIISGLSGNIGSDVAKSYEEFNSGHSEEWVRDYFKKWEARMVEKGAMYQEAGVDAMNISPTFQDPRFTGHEKLANELWKHCIAEVRNVFKGKVVVDYNVYGLVDGNNGGENWNQYDYYKDADEIEVKIYKILERYQNNIEKNDKSMREGITMMISDINSRAKAFGINVSIFFAPSSYTNGIFDGAVEVLDTRNEKVKTTAKNFEEQVNAFNYFFEALKGKQNITKVNVGNFAWDDALDPDVSPRISIAAGFRNKPAENVVQQWFLAK